jgi:hypothetical protein
MNKLSPQFRVEPVASSCVMMKTIQLPKNISLIQENLPSSNYNQITLKKQKSLVSVPSKLDVSQEKQWEDGLKKKTQSIPK